MDNSASKQHNTKLHFPANPKRKARKPSFIPGIRDVEAGSLRFGQDFSLPIFSEKAGVEPTTFCAEHNELNQIYVHLSCHKVRHEVMS